MTVVIGPERAELRYARDVLRLRGAQVLENEVDAGGKARVKLTLVPFAGPIETRIVEVPSAVWTTRLLATYLERVTGRRTGIETVRIHLHRLGYVWKRPT